ncbi:hypothetical protein GOP47_0000451 [Adiantum capillus-veneris]|uniref:Glutamyl-tRNA(Gln) amidotransferase subunit C, chloroplastic/mitochondrial n=1 Tax=Adiantum capillus-veneris TaxID=13818 RepID=A0A9D4VF64_ADICA|nr:hypothetical protein GOP47_0000451 [Adiantum capillus-veneris]
MVVGMMVGTTLRESARLLLPALAPPSLSRGRFRCCSSSSSSFKFEPSDVLQLAQKACITLTPQEVEDFQPKLQQLVGWFGQLQEVDLDSVLPAVRADNLSQRPLREDVPTPFEERDAIFAAVPETEGPFVKVPKILKENME